MRVLVSGAAGSLAASTELARLSGLTDPAGVSLAMVASVAESLRLVESALRARTAGGFD